MTMVPLLSFLLPTRRSWSLGSVECNAQAWDRFFARCLISRDLAAGPLVEADQNESFCNMSFLLRPHFEAHQPNSPRTLLSRDEQHPVPRRLERGCRR